MSIFESEAHEGGFGETSFGEYEQEAGFGETGFGEIFESESAFELQEVSSPLTEVQEMELAAELLEITNEEELEQFLGKLIKGAARAVGGIVKSPIGKALGGVLKNVAKTALPMVGGALGSMVAPGIGTALGSKLGSMASNLFEVELESMDREQAEFEAARRVVRFSAAAAGSAARAPQNAPPRAVVNRAVSTAARRYAPGLARGTVQVVGMSSNGAGQDQAMDPEPGYGRARTGRWVRRGRKIVLYGV